MQTIVRAIQFQTTKCGIVHNLTLFSNALPDSKNISEVRFVLRALDGVKTVRRRAALAFCSQ